MLNTNVTNKTRDLLQPIRRLCNGTKQTNRQSELLRHDTNRFDEIGVVGKHRSDIEVPLKRIANQVASQVYIASLFLGLPYPHDRRKRRQKGRNRSSKHPWRMHKARPELGDKKIAKVDRNLGNGLQGI